MDDDGTYLIERVPIHLLSSGRDLARLEDPGRLLTGLFALADPDYNASPIARLSTTDEQPDDSPLEQAEYASRSVRSGCGELNNITVEPLPGTRAEVERVTTTWGQINVDPVKVYLGAEASEESFKTEAPGNGVVHLATHGYFLEGICQPEARRTWRMDSDIGYVGENPLLLSGLFLAGANLHGEGTDSLAAEDGILTAEEVVSMNFAGTRLVVLSACETALGEVKLGEGVYGLRRAFQMAGARTVISALWPVSDEATAELMGRLYEKGAEALAETMRRVQLERINEIRAENKIDHPFTWGAFIALGDWR
jgi:CHAT domain-containing protein